MADLQTLAAVHRSAKARAEAAYRNLLNAVVAEAREPDANVQAIAKRAGIARGTIYNELARRQDRHDELSANGDAPAPAPADTDR